MIWSVLGSSGGSWVAPRGALRPFGILFVIIVALVGGARLVEADSALASAPEASELEVQSLLKVAEATFVGVLNPKATEFSEGGTYRFVYKASKTECEGGSETSPDLSMGAPHEELPPETVVGLAASTEYTACLSVTSLKGDTTVGAPVTFVTAAPPEAPTTGSPAAEVSGTSAKVEGILNPSTEATSGYYFAYQQSATECTAGSTTALEPEAKVKAKKVQAVLTGLEPNTEYTVCLVATNDAGETATGNPVSFKTELLKPTVISESAPTPARKATEARLEALVNPSNELAECHIQKIKR